MNKDRYTKFKADEMTVWKNRFIWRGLKNKDKIVSIGVAKYLSDMKPFVGYSCENISGANDFWKLTQKIGIQYVEWCKINSAKTLNDKELENLKNFFIGCIGEYFFCKLFENEHTLLISKDISKNVFKRYSFYDVCPRLIDEKDYGVDLTGTVSNGDKCKDCVFQVKFWNPYNEKIELTYTTLCKTYVDGDKNKFFNHDDNENIVVCWLSATNKMISTELRDSHLFDNLIFIDKKVLNDNINKQIPRFWDIFFESINQF